MATRQIAIISSPLQLSRARIAPRAFGTRMRRMKTLATVLAGIAIGALGTAAIAATQVGPADEATKTALVAVKRGIVAGHQAKDAAALDRLYADDYTAIDAKGVIRTKQDLLKALPTDAAIAEGRYDLIAVRRWGSVAVATGRGHLVYRNSDGSTRVSDYYSFNVFEERNRRWVYAAAFLP